MSSYTIIQFFLCLQMYFHMTIKTKTWPCMAGTFIDQGEAPDFYFQNYPEDHPVLGFFTWRWVLFLGFDHMYSSPIFLGMLALLGASLMACTYTTQLPLIKVSRRFGCMFSVFINAWFGKFLHC